MKPASESCTTCSRWNEIKRKLKLAKVMKGMMSGFEQRVKTKELKPTVAEYLKLLQIEEELNQESPKEIKVTWVEPETISNGEK